MAVVIKVPRSLAQLMYDVLDEHYQALSNHGTPTPKSVHGVLGDINAELDLTTQRLRVTKCQGAVLAAMRKEKAT